MSRVIFGFDPGTYSTGMVVAEVHGHDLKVTFAGDVENNQLYDLLNAEITLYRHINWQIEWALESMKSYNMRVGQEVFDTCVWIGEIRRQAKDNNISMSFYHRPDWAQHITGSAAKHDSDVAQALKLRWGDAAFKKGTKGTKKEPGREPGKYSMLSSSHTRSAFGVVFYHFDMGPAAKNKNIEVKND